MGTEVKFKTYKPTDCELAWYPNWMRWEYVSGIPGLRVAYGHYDTRSKRGYVDMLEVKENQRRKGIGRRADAEIQKFLKGLGMRVMTGHVMEGSEEWHRAIGHDVTPAAGHLPRATSRLVPVKPRKVKYILEHHIPPKTPGGSWETVTETVSAWH